MNPVRSLFTVLILLASILAFISFMPPQMGKWLYMWQAYVIKKAEVSRASGKREIRRLTVPANLNGTWSIYNNLGELVYRGDFQNGQPVGEHITYEIGRRIKVMSHFDSAKNQCFISHYSKTHCRYITQSTYYITDEGLPKSKPGTKTVDIFYCKTDDPKAIELDRREEFGISIP